MSDSFNIPTQQTNNDRITALENALPGGGGNAGGYGLFSIPSYNSSVTINNGTGSYTVTASYSGAAIYGYLSPSAGSGARCVAPFTYTVAASSGTWTYTINFYNVNLPNGTYNCIMYQFR